MPAETASQTTDGKLDMLGRILVRVFAHARVWGLLVAVALFWPRASRSTEVSATGWLMLFGGSVAYMLINPHLHLDG
jgi:predicted thioesterase